MSSSVMGPEADRSNSGEFSDKVPPRFDGHGSYSSYREDVSLWINLTTLPACKHGPAIVGRLQGEAKTAAKTIPTQAICREGGVGLILDRLDKAYAIDKTDQLDTDLADFLDYIWKKEVSIEHFISGFHTRVDKVADLKLNDKLKGHLLLRQANLAYHDRHVVIGASSGSYEVSRISAALRNIYRNHTPSDSSFSTVAHQGSRQQHRPDQHRSSPSRRGRRRGDRGRGRLNNNKTRGNAQQVRDNLGYEKQQQRDLHRERPVFYTYKTSADRSSPRVIVDSGACASVVGKQTLDLAMECLKLSTVEDATPRQTCHKFGNYDTEQPTIFAVKMPFTCGANNRGNAEPIEFDIEFDVIDGDLPFLLGLPSLSSMGANLNLKFNTLAFSMNGKYHRLQLVKERDHVSLPFNASTVILNNGRAGNTNNERQYYSRGAAVRTPSSCIGYHYYSGRQVANASTELRHEEPAPTSQSAPSSLYHVHTSTPIADSRSDLGQKGTIRNPPQTGESSYAAPWVAGTEAMHPPLASLLQHKRPTINASNQILDLSKADIKKLHLQLRHGTATALAAYIRAAGLFNGNVQSTINDVINECGCRAAFPPSPHTKVATRPPSTEPQARVSIDVIHLGGKNFLHAVDECTTWSEVGYLPRKLMQVQIEVLRRIQVLRHGPPSHIRCDREYDNSEFKKFCVSIGTSLVPVAANDHEANGLIENANRTLRSFFNRIQACDHRSSLEQITAEAVYGKNICIGSKQASAFELLYGRRPRLLERIDKNLPPPISIEQNARQLAQRRINKMLRSNVYRHDAIDVGDAVAIWRDNSGWLAPARVTKITPYYYEVIHNGRVKTSGINRTRLLPEHCDQNAATTPSNRKAQSIDGNDYDSVDTNSSYDEVNSELDTVNHGDMNGDGQPVNAIPAFDDDNPSTDTVSDGQLADAVPPSDDTAPPRNRTLPISRSEAARITAEARALVPQPLRATRSQTAAAAIQTAQDATPPDETQHDAFAHLNNGEEGAHCATHDRCHQPDTNAQASTNSVDSSVCAPLSETERQAAFEREIGEWRKREAFVAVDKGKVPQGANIIGSHVVYRRKLDGTTKARIVPWGHRDMDKDYLRGDAPSVSFEVFRLILSICSEKKWTVGQMDVKAAFLQALGFERTIYVRPPREAGCPEVLWLLQAAAYGLTDSGRLWYLTSDSELVCQHGLTRSSLDYTFYYSSNSNGQLNFALAVQVDDYLYGGTHERMEAFEDFLKGRFEVSMLARGTLSLMGCHITQHKDHSITLSQETMLDDLDPDILLAAAGHKGDGAATLKQATVYRHIIGKMLFIGRMSAPLVLMHASMAASKLSDLRCRHLRALSSIVKRLKAQPATLRFLSPPASLTPTLSIDIMSDAATAAGTETKGRGGHIIFRRFDDVVHPIHWTARKLRRVSRSSCTAEILSAAEATSMGIYLRALHAEFRPAPLAELTVDSMALMALSTSIKEPEERLNKVDLAAIREFFNNGDLIAVHWCPGNQLLADALTKDNRATGELLLNALASGRHKRPIETKTNFGQHHA